MFLLPRLYENFVINTSLTKKGGGGFLVPMIFHPVTKKEYAALFSIPTDIY